MKKWVLFLLLTGLVLLAWYNGIIYIDVSVVITQEQLWGAFDWIIQTLAAGLIGFYVSKEFGRDTKP